MGGGGTDDRTQEQMASYRSELGGIVTGLGGLGALARAGLIIIRSVTLICDNLVSSTERKAITT
jgi:hypothetical protein